MTEFGVSMFDVLMNKLFKYEIVYLIKSDNTIQRYRARRRNNNTFKINNKIYVVSKLSSAVHYFYENIATEIEKIEVVGDDDTKMKLVFSDDAMLILENENLKMLARASTEEFNELKMLVYVSITVSIIVLLALMLVYSQISHYSEWLRMLAQSTAQNTAHNVANTTQNGIIVP